MTKHIIIVAAALLLDCSNHVLSDELQNGREILEHKIDKILEKQSPKAPGISLIIRDNNQIVISKSKGVANSNENIPIDSKTGFRIGSISKPFTALAILQLKEQSKLSLNDSIKKYIGRLPSSWKTITIHQLLTHQVSLNKDFFSDEYLELANGSSNQDVIDFINTKNVVIETLAPKKASYCNTCYVLLAEVIKEVSGISFSEYMQKYIFDMAQMSNSYIVSRGTQLRQGDALNYAITDSFFGIIQFTTGAMAQVSSAEDLSKFIDSLKMLKLINAESLALMTESHAESIEGGQFGLGWFVGSEDRPFFAHGGSQDSYESELYFNPHLNIEFIFLSNGGEESFKLKRTLLRAVINHFEPK
ncbi:MAG: beta-lactamase family protein [Kangiellaceae bacterium]|nr:beta-lactamase family protein [Kangiellaceae bacterium]MCW8999396.1 beta-lactamase family protein [Kangiellaceae bacterium]